MRIIFIKKKKQRHKCLLISSIKNIHENKRSQHLFIPLLYSKNKQNKNKNQLSSNSTINSSSNLAIELTRIL